MKTFIEEYGLSILIAIVSFVLIVMATPVGKIVRQGLRDSLNEFKTEEIRNVRLCIDPNGGTKRNSIWCTEIEKDLYMEYEKDPVEGISFKVMDENGKTRDEYDIVAWFLRDEEVLSGLTLDGFHDNENGVFKAGKTRIAMTNQVSIMADWSGNAAVPVADRKGLSKGTRIEINGIPFYVLKIDKDNNALIVTEKVYSLNQSGNYSSEEFVLNNGVGYMTKITASINGLNVASAPWSRIIASVPVITEKNNGEYEVCSLCTGAFFSPSKDEIREGYDQAESRIKAKCGDVNLEYWTRTEGPAMDTACMVQADGKIDCTVNKNIKAGIRPAVWINIDKLEDGDYQITKE